MVPVVALEFTGAQTMTGKSCLCFAITVRHDGFTSFNNKNGNLHSAGSKGFTSFNNKNGNLHSAGSKVKFLKMYIQ